jgi:hypothetical protein
MGGYDQTAPGYVPPEQIFGSVSDATSSNDVIRRYFDKTNPDTFFDAVAGGEGAGNFTLNNTAGLWGMDDPWELDPWEA